ncbi:aminotransferase class I/II-fold pyridoxal phosphate-dependent enzyme [Dasania marina]|uniref:aminotransferase class I/II-fold pyridoxal phosphate-dependent enzyme n=1 Tax=Dasania marina TaxID=471499 RepID=UPI00036A9AF6|nr:aminotransferase class I/II-fold pyridoxal phosphate-dependent enzyme [Dasania marina]
MRLSQAAPEQLRELEKSLSEQYLTFQTAGLNLDLTRGKPSAEQLSLSNTLDGILNGNYSDGSGTDLRNYGGLDGLPEAKQLFADMLGVQAQDILVGGNGSLPMMYFSLQTALSQGLAGKDSAWSLQGPVKFLAPVPGYDRHFTASQHLGIELIPVAMNEYGPDMDQVEALVKSDPSIKGIWCVPRFSNPTGIVYSDDVVNRMAKLGHIAGDHFRIFWDNAYAVHVLDDQAPVLANLYEACKSAGTEDSVLIFGSTSKITFAGAGVGFMAASTSNLSALKDALGYSTIGPDKVNQYRHVKFLKDQATLTEHMKKHAAIMKPRFDAVLQQLKSELGDDDIASWTEPQGGYFISVDTRPGLAKQVIQLAAEAGVKLTPAGAPFPYGKDPQDSNIRIAPSFPSIEDLKQATAVFITCLKLATVRQALAS